MKFNYKELKLLNYALYEAWGSDYTSYIIDGIKINRLRRRIIKKIKKKEKKNGSNNELAKGSKWK